MRTRLIQDHANKIEVVAKQLTVIGIYCRKDTWSTSNTFSGCNIHEGTITYNPNRVTLDRLIHEAGHIAVCPTRKLLSGWITTQESDEYAAIAWSYCMALALNLPLKEVFGIQFKELEQVEITMQLMDKKHPGINTLVRLKMLESVEAFPNLTKWLVDQDAN